MKLERKQIQEIEFLFEQSKQGLHILFNDTKKLTDILSTPTQEKSLFDSKNRDKVQELFTGLVTQKTFKDKENYLSTLNAENFEILVRIYFHILDNTILTQDKTIH